MNAFKTVPFAMAAMLAAGAALAQPAPQPNAPLPSSQATTGQTATGQATTGQATTGQATVGQATTGQATSTTTPSRPAGHKHMARAETSVSGKVDALFGRQIVIATDDGGKVLVDLGRHAKLQQPLTPGEAVKATGWMERNHRFEARALTRADGTAIPLRSADHSEGKHHWHHDHAAAAPAGTAPTTTTN